MNVFTGTLAAALLAVGVHAADGKERLPAPSRPSVVVRQSTAAIRPVAVEESPAETVPAPSEAPAAQDSLQTRAILQGSGVPSSPYPAGLSYMMSPQPFRVPYPDRIYYPPKHYVYQCPYYPRGVYWGADWYKRLLGHNPWLIHGCKRFNPYLTEAKIRHHAGGHAAVHGSAPCPRCHQRHVMAADQAPLNETSPVLQASNDVAESPRPLASQVAAPEQPEPSHVSTAAVKEVRTSRKTVPSWQRAPVVRR